MGATSLASSPARRPPLERDEQAGTGISNLQLLIPIALIASLAGGALIQVSQDVGEQASRTAALSLNSISGGYQIVLIAGDRDATPTNVSDASSSLKPEVQYLELVIQLLPGSQPQDLQDLVILYSDRYWSAIMHYDAQAAYLNSAATANLTPIQLAEQLKTRSGAATFTAFELRDPGNDFDPRLASDNVTLTGAVVSRGALMKVYLNLSAAGVGLSVGTEAELQLMPMGGQATFRVFRAPDTFTSRFVVLG